MHRDFKVVICIAAGRWRHMEILLKHLDKYREVVDRVDLWVNCVDAEDRQRLRITAALDAHYRLVELPDITIIDPAVLWHSVCKFYRYACDVDTIYIKCDDDIVWVDDVEHFRKFLDFRIDNEKYFLISANVIVNAICDHLHQKAGCLPEHLEVIAYDAHDSKVFSEGKSVEAIHEHVLSNQGPDARRWDLSTEHEVDDNARICINFVCWFGKDFAAFMGEVPKEDETWLTTIKTKELNRSVGICPDFGCVHYSFGPTRKHLDAGGLLKKYRLVAGLS